MQKSSIFLEEFKSEKLFGARAFPRALRAIVSIPKMPFLAIFLSTGVCAQIERARKCARENLARGIG